MVVLLGLVDFYKFEFIKTFSFGVLTLTCTNFLLPYSFYKSYLGFDINLFLRVKFHVIQE